MREHLKIRNEGKMEVKFKMNEREVVVVSTGLRGRRRRGFHRGMLDIRFLHSYMINNCMDICHIIMRCH